VWIGFAKAKRRLAEQKWIWCVFVLSAVEKDIENSLGMVLSKPKKVAHGNPFLQCGTLRAFGKWIKC